MTVRTGASDKGIGYTVTLSLLSLLGALVVLLNPADPIAGWGFALAMTAAALAVAAAGVYRG